MSGSRGRGSLPALFGTRGLSRQRVPVPLCLSEHLCFRGSWVCRVCTLLYTVECVCLCTGVVARYSSPESGCVAVRVCLGVRVSIGVWFCVPVYVCVCVSVCWGRGETIRACVGCLCMYVWKVGWPVKFPKLLYANISAPLPEVDIQVARKGAWVRLLRGA